MGLNGYYSAAKYGGSTGVMACRIIQGIAQGGLFPSCHTMLGRWGPENERGRMSTFVYSGMPIGTIVCLPITGIISKSYLGWPATCYLFGGCGFAWCAICLYFGFNSHAAHPAISTEEKKYIEESLNQSKNEKVLPTPWKENITSLPCWACLVSTVGSGFGIIFLQNEMPTYLEKVMKYDVTSSGYLTPMTAIVSFVMGYIYGPLADFIVEKKYVSRTNARIISAIYATFGSAATMLGLAYLHESQAHMSVLILSLSSVFDSAILFGHGVNPIDLSPRFSGIIWCCANSASSLVALTAPLAVQFIVHEEFLNMEKHQKHIHEKRDLYVGPNENDKGPFFGKRHVQALLLFLCVTIEMMTRSSLSLSIVAMTDNSTSVNPNVPTYNWSDKNVILSSFYWGYMLLQVLAGQLGKNYGAKWLLFSAMGLNSLALTLVPMAAKYGGSTGVMACRIFQGIAQGGLFPSCHTMLGRWGPENERGRMSTFIYSGMSIGTIVCLPITGIISKSYLGWPATCYLFGGCGFAWCAIWFYFGFNSPAAHPSISSEEKKYIEASLNQSENEKVLPTPWKEIITSLPCWACLVSTVGSGFGIIFLQNELPTYLEKVMKYNVTSSGYLTSMTAFVSLVFGYIYGPLADFIVEKNYVSRTNARKFFEIYATFGSAATMLVLAYLDESQAYMSVFILSLSSVFGSAILFGHGVNPIDLSPRFSGIILGWANSASCLAALTAPLAVQFIVHEEENASEWRTVFLIAAAMYTGPSIFFALFSSAERQWWDSGAENMPKDIFSGNNDQEHVSHQRDRKIGKISGNV